MDRKKKIMEVLKELGIKSEDDLKATIKNTTVNISTMAAGKREPNKIAG